MTGNRHLLALLCVLLVTACADMAAAPPDPRRAAVEQLFSRLQNDMRAGNWNRIEWAFSPNFRAQREVADRWESRWTRERIVELQLIPGRVLETGGLLNVQVRWNQVTSDRAGRFRKLSGNTEAVLEARGGEYRIRQLSGDPLF